MDERALGSAAWEEIVDIMIRTLRILNIVFAVAILAIALIEVIGSGSVIALLILLGLIAVGPLEDLLMRYLRIPGVDPKQTAEMIDQSTSLALLIALTVVLLLLRGMG